MGRAALTLAFVGFALLFGGLIARDLLSGVSRLRGVAYTRRARPLGYWASIAIMALFAAISLLSAVRVLL